MDDSVKKLVEESGIIPHLKTRDVLLSKGWSVLVSPYYHDSISDSVRETDLIAEKHFDSGYGYGSKIHVTFQLFIECKYVKQQVVFWFDKIDFNKAVMATEKETGLNIVYAGYKHSGDVAPNELRQFANEDVAKLFSSNLSREDVIYKAMNQCLHSQLHFRERGKGSINVKNNAHPQALNKFIHVPIIVCDNFKNLLQVQFGHDNSFNTDSLDPHFVLEVNYRDDYFLVDIVDINRLDLFLDLLDREAKKLIQIYSLKGRLA